MEVKNRVADSSGQQLLTGTKIDSYAMIFLYSIQDFLRWWYVQMPIWHLRELNRLSTFVDDQVSLSLLFRTFFVPWHRDASLLGVVFGITMRLLYLPIALFIYLLVISVYLVLILAWLLLPIGTLTFILTSLFK